MVVNLASKMICEVQRRFLIENDDFIKILKKEKLAYSKDKIRVFFTRINPFCDIKYKKINQDYYQFTFYKLHDILDKKIHKISKKEFKHQGKNAITDIVKKTRISFELDNTQFFLYKFKNNLKNLVILKVIFFTIEEAKRFVLPHFFKNYKEITYDENFYSKNLALYGDFSKVFDSARCIKILDKQKDINLHFPNQIQSFNAGKILLFVLLKNLKNDRLNFLKNSSEKNLEQCFISLKQICFCFDVFDALFEKNIQNKLKQQFLFLINQINMKKYHEFELEKYIFILSDEKINDIFLDMDFILKNDYEFYQGKNQILKSLIAFKLRKELVFLKKKIVKSQTNLEEELEKIKFLLCYFATMFEEKSIKKLKNYFKYKHLDQNSYDENIIKQIEKSIKKLKIYS
ncbi:hypothetical protein ACSKW8_000822 [Campylobacter lari]|uniref:hypothetical protein n=1 Tax=Campylobacter lari TaxID=201 RepID=UPI0013BDFC7E|nr:hypothetical protein [Campylobacter lari]EAI3897618.1 hypothetical protein [Campylobacter lari]EAI3897862.1 hypothetical protein [Campylobacter lari]EDP6875287.1 hypothetical protein [Campylobacter lari]EDP6875653.1 hypothetical protein [Campylobacter lari]EHS0800360.1 hypothetical protein [Campylobacter lari]